MQVDDHSGKPAYRVRAGQRVRIVLPEIPRQSPRPEDIPLEILFEDEDLVVVNKPPGMVVHPARGHWSGTLASALQFHFRPEPQQQRRPAAAGHRPPPRPRHQRRDPRRPARPGPSAKLAEQFESRSIEKEYFALVAGTPELDRDIIDRPIAVHPMHREKMTTCRDDGREAAPRRRSTRGRAVPRFCGRAGDAQDRPHAPDSRPPGAHRLPVLCDRAYGHRAEITRGEIRRDAGRHDRAARSPGAARPAAAVRSIRAAASMMEIEAPLPADIAGVLEAPQGVPLTSFSLTW